MASKFIKKSLKHRCFPVNIAKFLKTAFLLNTSGGCYNSSKYLIDSMTFVSLFLLQIYQIYFLEWVILSGIFYDSTGDGEYCRSFSKKI